MRLVTSYTNCHSFYMFDDIITNTVPPIVKSHRHLIVHHLFLAFSTDPFDPKTYLIIPFLSLSQYEMKICYFPMKLFGKKNWI